MKEKIYEDSKILVVDDVEEVLSATKSTLKFEGMNVKTYSNPKEALEYLKNNKVDVLLLDFFMPEMNGDKFIEELRKFNKDTIIILRTGYSDKVPPMEMLDSLNIQGYIDKLKGDDELVLMTKSAIKTSYLYKQLLEQQRKISMLEYKNDFLGKFIYKIIGEIKEKSMVIGGLSKVIAEDFDTINKEDIIRYSKEINQSMEKLGEFARKFEVEDLGVINITRLKEVMVSLFSLDFLFKKINFNFEIENDEIIDCDSRIIIYILSEIIDFLIKKDATTIEVKYRENKIIFENQDFDENLINKISDMAEKSNEKMKINYNDNKIELVFN